MADTRHRILIVYRCDQKRSTFLLRVSAFLLRSQEVGDLLRRQGPAKEITLRTKAAQVAEDVCLLCRFHAFPDRLEAAGPDQLKDRCHQRGLARVAAEACDQGAVHLDPINGKPAQVADGGIACTEVIDFNAYPSPRSPPSE